MLIEGDLVVLRGGGPTMTVLGVTDQRPGMAGAKATGMEIPPFIINCGWFDGSSYSRDVFTAEVLWLVED